ncbi:hypothetical protein LTR36_010608 [Oleoguttula mirabilis]|uniref:Uncharacterized protein n=1 Tax=Oleoguttula mirabilis TaxID=1507867 RepID=A0AAV9JQI6_9PEZI|nr:hypothetical protein LTR36_010608 [Oleoguttula mirabilis]
MAVTIHANGEEVKDQYWLLKSYRHLQSTVRGGDGKEQVFQKVNAVPCNLGDYQTSAQLHKRLLEWGGYRKIMATEQIHGRRVNDEVELFGMDSDGTETPNLREGMEKMGLTVRSWAPEGMKSKFPSRRRVFGQETSFLDKCRKTMHEAVVSYEIETDEPIPYALLADSGTEAKHGKHLLVVIVDAGYYQAVHANAEQTITANGCPYKVIGFYHDRKTHFIKDEVAKSFFTKNGEHVDLQFYNHTKRLADEAAEAVKQEKRAAKKHRRQQTAASSITMMSSGGVDTVQKDGGEDAEARAEAKREKERAKKKAYQARRRAKQAEAEQAITLAREVDRKAHVEEESDQVGLGLWHVVNFAGLTIMQSLGRRDSAGEVVSETSDDTEDKYELLGVEDSSSSEGADASPVDSKGLTVIKVDDRESGRRAVAEAKGPVLVMAQEDVDIEPGEYNTGFRFRGLKR